MATRMQQRRGTVLEWATANPILADGEVGFERETGVIKIGDGVTAWNALQSAFITRAVVEAQGDLLVGTADETLGRLAKGTAGQRLTVGADGVLFWEDKHDVVDAAGDLIVGSGPNTVVRVAKGAPGDRLLVKADGTVGWEPLPAAANPFVAVDAAGDLLVGTGPDAVGRLAKGANGQVLSIDGTGALFWTTPSAVDNSKVAKAGDTMTGNLTMSGKRLVATDQSGTDAFTGNGIEVASTGTGIPARVVFHIPGVLAHQIGVDDSGLRTFDQAGTGLAQLRASRFRSNDVVLPDILMRDGGGHLRIVNEADNTWKEVRAGALYDNGNRVYSASNPPPVSGMKILASGQFPDIQSVNTSQQGVWNETNTTISFTAPASGTVEIEFSVGFPNDMTTASPLSFRVEQWEGSAQGLAYVENDTRYARGCMPWNASGGWGQDPKTVTIPLTGLSSGAGYSLRFIYNDNSGGLGPGRRPARAVNMIIKG